MDQAMQGMQGMTSMQHPSGTFAGHVIPGVMLLIWGSCWLVELWRGGGRRPAGSALETLPFVVGLKLVLPLIGVAIEWPGAGWRPVDRVMNFQHVSMYAFFALSGLVDLLHRRGELPRGATYVAFAGAAVNAGALFLAHGAGGGAGGTVHFLLAMSFFAAALFGIAEWLRPDLDLHWLRVGAILTVGSWFLQVARILFRSGWDLMDPTVQMRSSLFFSWDVLGVALVLLALRVLRAWAPAPEARASRVGVRSEGVA